MNEDVRSRIHQLIDSINDENVLKMVLENVTYFARNKDILDELDKDQLQELEEAIAEADNGETVDWENFKKEMEEWKKR